MLAKIIETAAVSIVQFKKVSELCEKEYPNISTKVIQKYDYLSNKMDKIFLALNEKERHLAEYLAKIETGDISTGNPFVRFVGKPN